MTVFIAANLLTGFALAQFFRFPILIPATLASIMIGLLIPDIQIGLPWLSGPAFLGAVALQSGYLLGSLKPIGILRQRQVWLTGSYILPAGQDLEGRRGSSGRC